MHINAAFKFRGKILNTYSKFVSGLVYFCPTAFKFRGKILNTYSKFVSGLVYFCPTAFKFRGKILNTYSKFVSGLVYFCPTAFKSCVPFLRTERDRKPKECYMNKCSHINCSSVLLQSLGGCFFYGGVGFARSLVCSKGCM